MTAALVSSYLLFLLPVPAVFTPQIHKYRSSLHKDVSCVFNPQTEPSQNRVSCSQELCRRPLTHDIVRLNRSQTSWSYRETLNKRGAAENSVRTCFRNQKNSSHLAECPPLLPWTIPFRVDGWQIVHLKPAAVFIIDHQRSIKSVHNSVCLLWIQPEMMSHL